MSRSFAENQRLFRSNPSINPETNRPIKPGTLKHEQLVTKYGLSGQRKSPTTRRSPKTRKSPTKTTTIKTTRSPRGITTTRTTRSPRGITTVRTTRSRSQSPSRSVSRSISPVRRTTVRNINRSRSPNRKIRDDFEVLSEQSVLNVLNKLSPDHRREWINASPYVRGIAARHNIM